MKDSIGLLIRKWWLALKSGADYTGFDDIATSKAYLIILTAMYFVVEIVVNIMIFKELSIQSDFFTVEAMEFWGRIISGLGLALMIVRSIYFKVNHIKLRSKRWAGRGLRAFIYASLVLVPLSFYGQEALISYLTENATDEERNNAVLVTAVHTTLKPHYPGSQDTVGPTSLLKAVSPLLDSKTGYQVSYIEQERVFYNASIACIPASADALGVHSNVDKAFFAYNAFKEPMKTELYKQVITDYYSCLQDNEEYSNATEIGRAFPQHRDQIDAAFAQYSKATKNYEAEDRTNKLKEETYEKQTKELNKEWRDGIDDFLQFKSSIEPSLTKEEFIVHPDVKNYFVKKADNPKYIYPHDPEYAEKKEEVVTLKLPNIVIPTYIDENGDALGNIMPLYRDDDGNTLPLGTEIEITDELILKTGKLAYKAIIMPQVAMGLSMTLLLLTSLSMINVFAKFRVKRWKSYRVYGRYTEKNIVFKVLLVICLIIPTVIVSNVYSDKDIANRGYVIKTLYFYEKNLAGLFVQSEDTILTEIEPLDSEEVQSLVLWNINQDLVELGWFYAEPIPERVDRSFGPPEK